MSKSRNGRYTPPRDEGWKEVLQSSIDNGEVEAKEIQALWCDSERFSIDALDDEAAVAHLDDCEGPHHILFIFVPVRG